MSIDNTVIENLRRDYSSAALDITDVASNPFEQFGKWFKEALSSEVLEPNAMTLSTADKNGKPSARIVLLKGFDKDGFVFYTNYGSAKAAELLENPQAALTFLWLELQRQVRIDGTVEKVSCQESEKYFQSRPKGSQIGAYASPQSQVIEDRTILEKNVEELTAKYQDVDVLPLPDNWGGYRVKPTLIEFWQGRPSRLHDRMVYQRQENDNWKIERLAP